MTCNADKGRHVCGNIYGEMELRYRGRSHCFIAFYGVQIVAGMVVVSKIYLQSNYKGYLT